MRFSNIGRIRIEFTGIFVAVRKVTPAPTPVTRRPQSAKRPAEPTLEEAEEPIDLPTETPSRPQELPAVPDRASLSKQYSSDSSPQKPSIQRDKKPSLYKSPILPPTSREFVPIQAVQIPEEKRAKSQSNPGTPQASPKPASKKFGFFKKEQKSTENLQKASRSATGDGLDSIDGATSGEKEKGPQKVKIPNIFSKK